jgi:hypothetical protein
MLLERRGLRRVGYLARGEFCEGWFVLADCEPMDAGLDR